ncbi:hypothetical protein PS1_036489 [Malus domestica]
MLVQTRSIMPCSLGSCRQGALVLPFMLVQTRSVWCRVAVSARVGKERWCCLLCSCRPGAFGAVLQFQLVQARSVVPCSLGSCEQGALVLPFMLVQTRSFVPCSLDSCGR